MVPQGARSSPISKSAVGRCTLFGEGPASARKTRLFRLLAWALIVWTAPASVIGIGGQMLDKRMVQPLHRGDYPTIERQLVARLLRPRAFHPDYATDGQRTYRLAAELTLGGIVAEVNNTVRVPDGI